MANLFKNPSWWFKASNLLKISIGTSTILGLTAIVNPDVATAQYYPNGVRSRVIPPTPLNISPRTHIPLPQSNRSRYRDYDRYDRYGYDRYDRSEDCDRDDYRRSRYKRDNRRNILIYPSGDRYPTRGGYIRIVR
jgi:hypothetical protein